MWKHYQDDILNLFLCPKVTMKFVALLLERQRVLHSKKIPSPDQKDSLGAYLFSLLLLTDRY